MKREPTTRHSLTGFPTGDDTSQIFKEVCEDSVAPGEAKRYLSWSDLSITRSADILINSAFSFTNGPNIKSDQYDTWTVFIHEAGHVAGLDHSSEETEVMYVSGSGIFKRSLGYFDALGISNLY